MQPPISPPSPHLWAINMTTFTTALAVTDDFRGTDFARQPKQLKNALFQINEKICVFKLMSSQAFSQELLNYKAGAFLILKYSLYLGASPYCSPRIPKQFIWSTRFFTSPEVNTWLGRSARQDPHTPASSTSAPGPRLPTGHPHSTISGTGELAELIPHRHPCCIFRGNLRLLSI